MWAPKSTRAAVRCSPKIRTTPISPGAPRSSMSMGHSYRAPACAAIAAHSWVTTGRCAIRVPFTLAAGQKHELAFRLGAGATHEEASALVQRWRGSVAAHEALAE